MSRIVVITAALSLAAIFTTASLAHAEAEFIARLSGQQEVPALAVAGQGSGVATLTSAGIQFYVTAEGLLGPITAIHFHDGAAGVAGPVVRDIMPELRGNTAFGLWSASDAQPLTSSLIADFLNGDLYFNVHTAANAGGEIRGQLVPSSGAHFTANLTGDQERPAIATAATGTGTFVLTEEALIFKITVNGLSGAPTAAHFHAGGIGVNGGVEISILPFFSGNTATGSVVLTAAQRRLLLTGGLYVNVHTAANPGGEIRGQVLLAGGLGFSVRLDGTQEVPANASPGTATATATLTPSGLVMTITRVDLSGALTNAHFHNAATGVNGGVVRTILPDFAGGPTATVLWRYDDAEPLTPMLVNELINGRIYVNLHTVAFPGGEIRGQVLLNQPSASPAATFAANLNKNQEVPATASTGTGTGTFTLTPAGLAFRVTVSGLTGAMSAAHFHSAKIGVNGGVVRSILPDFVGNTASGVWTPADASPLTPALVTELLKGNLYVNVHTAANPGGEIRGQVVAASGTDFEARMTSAQETPPTGAAATGTASLTLTNDGLAFAVTVEGLTGAIAAAHFHSGAPGVAGGVVRAITTDFVGNTAIGVWKPSDASPLTPALITALLKGNLYLNVHTAANPAGEIRGQVRLAGGAGHGAFLAGGNEAPTPVSTLALGSSAMTLTDQGIVFRTSVNDLTGAITAAHFHDAPFGVAGPVVRAITTDFTALTADGIWTPADASPLTTTLIGEYFLENLYLNVHTATNPGGEIRGQTGVRGVASVEPEAVAGALKLTARPNPAYGRTALSFDLPRAGNGRIAVFDLGGRQVAEVARGPWTAGRHELTFDTRGLDPGLYFLRIGVGGLEQSRKMLVLQ